MKKILKVLNYKLGYKVKTILYSGEHALGDDSFEMRTAYTPDDRYIGDPKFARFLTKKMGLSQIQYAQADHTVCSIGFNEEEQKWYGWSHRAICGFGIGNRIFEAHYGKDDTPFIEHGHETIETMQHAKTAAINFGRYVS